MYRPEFVRRPKVTVGGGGMPGGFPSGGSDAYRADRVPRRAPLLLAIISFLLKSFELPRQSNSNTYELPEL